MAMIDEITLPTSISLPECQARSASHSIETPCGLRISHDVPIPGAFWPAIRAAHQAHHDTGHADEFVLLTTTSINGASVTVTFSCVCEKIDS